MEKDFPALDEDKLIITVSTENLGQSISEPATLPQGHLEQVIEEMIASSVQKALESAMPHLVKKIAAELKEQSEG